MTTAVKQAPSSLTGIEMLESFAARGINIALSSDGQKLLCRSATLNGITAQMRAEIAANKPAIIAALTARAADQANSDRQPPASSLSPPTASPSPQPAALPFRRPALTTSPNWPADLAALLLTLAPADLPAVPFEFGGPYCVVVDCSRFLRSLKADVDIGPSGPRAMYGAIQADLRRLHSMLPDEASEQTAA
jgi:hypothetical protein